MLTVYRYKTMKPRDGKIELVYHRDGSILGYTEVWNKENGWEVALDILCDTRVPVERRRFFLCTGGDDLTPLGENAFAYHVGTHQAKGYTSYLFDITHLPEQVIETLEANWGRLQRRPPSEDELSYKAKQAIRREERRKEVQKSREDNERARQERLARLRSGADALVASREAADTERAKMTEDEPPLRLVEES